MLEIKYKNRETGKIEKEKVYGKFFLDALYGETFLGKTFSLFFLPLISHIPFFSHFYGKRQKKKRSRLKILPFIQKFHVDISEFADSVEHFSSFNDFFIRKLKPEARPIQSHPKEAILPADGRYLVFPNLSQVEGFYVKGQKLDLALLLHDATLFKRYEKGSMVIARLCPTDYHRFHFPVDCIPGDSKLINGSLFSVNPIALRKYLSILNENKRMFTLLDGDFFGQIAYIEVGATCVGSIQQTYQPHTPYSKGDEKGYFEFGGSCLILLFEPEKIRFSQDLIENSQNHLETYAKMGQSLGSIL